MKKFLIVLAVVLFPAFAQAEVNATPVFRLGTDFFGGFGFKEPGFSFGGGLEMTTPKTWLSVTGTYDPTDKVAYGNTYSLGGSFLVLGRLPKGFLLGAGASGTKLYFVDLNTAKKAIRSRIGGGWEYGPYRILVYRFFSVHDHSNHSEGFNISFDAYASSKVRIEIKSIIATFDTNSYQPKLGRTTSAGMSINLVYLPFR